MTTPDSSPVSIQSVLVGSWTYRSYLNIADLNKQPNDLLFGSGTIRLDTTPLPNQLSGLIYGPGWELRLAGSINYGDPFTLRFKGQGVVSGSEWIYEYVGYLINPWQNGVNQVPAFVGSVIRQIPHPDGQGGTSPAGVVASFISVRQS